VFLPKAENLVKIKSERGSAILKLYCVVVDTKFYASYCAWFRSSRTQQTTPTVLLCKSTTENLSMITTLQTRTGHPKKPMCYFIQPAPCVWFPFSVTLTKTSWHSKWTQPHTHTNDLTLQVTILFTDTALVTQRNTRNFKILSMCQHCSGKYPQMWY